MEINFKSKMTIITLILTIFCLTENESAAEKQKLKAGLVSSWANKYSYDNGFETNELLPNSIILTRDGGFLIGQGGFLKLNALGSVEWQKDYSTVCRCSISAVVENTRGGFTGAGTVDFIDESYIVVIRINNEGNPIWSKRYRRTKFDRVHSFIRTRDGGYLLGAFGRNGSKDGRMWLVKIGATGSIQWQKIYNVAEPSSIMQLSNGDFLVGTSRFSVLRLTSTGNVKWQRKYSDVGCCSGGLMQYLGDGTFALAGHRITNGQNSVVVLKSDFSDRIIFSKSYSKQELADFRSTRDGGFILLTRRSQPGLSSRISVLKLDTVGNVSWRVIASEKELNIPRLTLQTPDGGYVLTDSVQWIVKLDPSGNTPGLCRSIFRRIDTTVQNISIVAETRAPSVLPTRAVPLIENFMPDPVTPIAEPICPP